LPYPRNSISRLPYRVVPDGGASGEAWMLASLVVLPEDERSDGIPRDQMWLPSNENRDSLRWAERYLVLARSQRIIDLRKGGK
ncbi:MAG: hypothetical protein ACKN9U_24835, partial [Pirellulaceae bacterium]